MNPLLEDQQAEQARRVSRAEFMTRLFILVGVVFLTTSMVTNVVLAGLIRHTQIEGTPTGRKLVASADRILDCTDPQGECYKDSQKRTAEVLSSVQRIILISAACAVELAPTDPVQVRIEQVTSCVTERLTAGHS